MQTLTYKKWCPKKNRDIVIYVRDLIKGHEWYLRKIDNEELEELGYVLFYDIRINRYIVYQLVRVAIRTFENNIDQWTKKQIGKYIRIMIVEGEERTYRPFGHWVIEQLRRAKVHKTFHSKDNVYSALGKIEEISEAEKNYQCKKEAVLREFYKDWDNCDAGRVVSSMSYKGNSYLREQRRKKIIFVSKKTGKVLGHTNKRGKIVKT